MTKWINNDRYELYTTLTNTIITKNHKILRIFEATEDFIAIQIFKNIK